MAKYNGLQKIKKQPSHKKSVKGLLKEIYILCILAT